MITKPKLSSLVSGQLPEFIREDYQTFIAFLEAYYEYLDQNVNLDFHSVGDIDTTLDSFVQYFKNEVAVNFPTLQTDDRFLIPKLKQLYTSKGTEASYKLLFRLLYNKEIDVKYPSKQILRVSDGKWIQDVSVFAKLVAGNPNDIVGKFITITTIDKKITVFIDRYLTTNISGIYEFFITGGWTGTFEVGDVLSYEETSFFADIVATTASIEILQGGKNFRLGQTYTIAGTGNNSVIKITRVDSVGSIKTAKIIKFGAGYVADFTASILATATNTTLVDLFSKSNFQKVFDGSSASIVNVTNNTIIIPDHGLTNGNLVTYSTTGTDIGGLTNNSIYYVIYVDVDTIKLASTQLDSVINNPIDITAVGTDTNHSLTVNEAYLNDSISTIEDTSIINKYDYAYTGSNLWTNAPYVGTALATSTDSTGTSLSSASDYALLAIKLGAVAKYPGYYNDTDGFLDDTRYIQDSRYYQQFSYVIQVDEKFESYKSIIKNLIHPAGTEIFGEYNITLNINYNINSDIRMHGNLIITEDGVYLTTESDDILASES